MNAANISARGILQGLDAFFIPRTVAVVGATDRPSSVGRTILANLLDPAYHGRVFAVNPNRNEVLGLACYPRIGSVPEKVDLAVIVTPAPTVPAAIGECVESGVKAAVVISAGFREFGAEGANLEKQIQAQLRKGRMRLMGPNCLGLMNPLVGLNATFAQAPARKGSVAFLSQSGALLTAILDWSAKEQVGFSAIVSTGSMLDVGFGDLIDYFGDEPQTQSILLYMESVGDARSFLSSAREVAQKKPIIVIKAGRTEAASHAAASHTGALTGSDEVFEAALRRCGVLRVQNISDLFYMAEVLGKQPRPRGSRLTILTNAGGPGVLATDSLIANGGQLAVLPEQSMRALDEFLPPHWSHANPIDILGDSDPERYARALEIAAANPESDGLLVVLAPQGMTNPASVAERLTPYAKSTGKPLLASWMGGEVVAGGEAILNSGGIPTFNYPDTAARAFTYMWRYSYNLRGLYETPVLADEPGDVGVSTAQAAAILQKARAAGRMVLTELESKQILALYGIPVVETVVARSQQEAVEAAASIGYPVVLKIYSEIITHKTDVGGVKLNLAGESAVRDAYREIESAAKAKAAPGSFLGVTVQPMVRVDGYELILGSSLDPQFGPVLLFGSGGQLVEVYRDHALALPPLNTTLAQRMMEQTRIFAALQGVRGRAPVDLLQLEKILVRFSRLVVEQRLIKEIDINPLLASSDRLLALDARINVHGLEIPDDRLPKAAIQPYPLQYVTPWRLCAGDPITVRPIRPEDEPLIAKFHATLSEQTVYLRYFHVMNLSSRVAHDRLIRSCFIDYDREMALVADHLNHVSGEHQIIAVARLSKSRVENEAEVSVLVTDQWQHQGLGKYLLERLIQVARDQKLDRVIANILPENSDMQALATRFGFSVRETGEPDLVVAVLDLE
ncbi:MAG: GNAT family N-acetyltransferase [Candidatus Acidiferrales bacterium]